MKRTKSIDLERMRKRSNTPRLKPLVVSVAAISLAACSDRKASIYSSIEHCKANTPSSMAATCESAYKKAVEKASKTSPKYATKRACGLDFGSRNCISYASPQGQNWYMPAMAAFALSEPSQDENEHESEPLYTSHSYNSGFYGYWTTGDGRTYKKRYGRTTVRSDTFKPKPTVTKTVSRGGFGSTVAAKSSWGGSSSRSGWGS